MYSFAHNSKTYKKSLLKSQFKNLQKPVLEIYEVVNRLCPEIMNEVFQFQIQLTHYNVRNNSTLSPSFNTIIKGKCILSSLKIMEPSTRQNKIFRILYKFLKSNQEMGTTKVPL